MWRSIGQVDGAFFDRCRVDRAELSRLSVDLGAMEPPFQNIEKHDAKSQLPCGSTKNSKFVISWIVLPCRFEEVFSRPGVDFGTPFLHFS